MKPHVQAVNENSIIVYFDNKIKPELPSIIANTISRIKASDFASSIIDFTPSYHSLLINFNLLHYSTVELVDRLNELVVTQDKGPLKPGKLITIPVYYSPETGPDLILATETLKLSMQELISLHSTRVYQVYALGFLPGYAFMGIIDERLVLPRLAIPRPKVRAGSVAIAQKQTAVYPAETPGGWHLLGRTPLELFNIKSNPPQPYQIGDQVKFNSIERLEYLELGGQL